MTTARSFKWRIDELAHGTNETAMRRDSGETQRPRQKTAIPSGGRQAFQEPPPEARTAFQPTHETLANWEGKWLRRCY